MLHPITCEILSEGDQYDRAVQREALQLRKELTAARVKYPGLFGLYGYANRLKVNFQESILDNNIQGELLGVGPINKLTEQLLLTRTVQIESPLIAGPARTPSMAKWITNCTRGLPVYPRRSHGRKWDKTKSIIGATKS